MRRHVRRANGLVLFHIRLNKKTRHNMHRSIVPHRLPRVRPLRTNRKFAIVGRLTPPRRFIGSVFHFPHTHRDIFQIKSTSCRHSTIPTRISTHSNRSIHKELTNSTTRRRRTIICRVSTTNTNFLLCIRGTSMGTNKYVTKRFSSARRTIPSRRFQTLHQRVRFQNRRPTIHRNSSTFVLPNTLGTPLTRRGTTTISFRTTINFIPRRGNRVVQRVTRRHRNTSIPSSRINNTIPIIQLIKTTRMGEDISSMGVSTKVGNGKVLGIHLTLRCVVTSNSQTRMKSAIRK